MGMGITATTTNTVAKSKINYDRLWFRVEFVLKFLYIAIDVCIYVYVF